MKVVLELQDQPSNVRRITVRHDIVIGRGSDCNLRLSAPQVSRRHCFLRVGRDSVSVTDLDSSNGTFIDGTRITAGKRYDIANGAELALGPIRFTIHVRSDVAVAETADAGSTPDSKRSNAGRNVVAAFAAVESETINAQIRPDGAKLPMDYAVEQAGESAEPNEPTADCLDEKFSANGTANLFSNAPDPADSRVGVEDFGKHRAEQLDSNEETNDFPDSGIVGKSAVAHEEPRWDSNIDETTSSPKNAEAPNTDDDMESAWLSVDDDDTMHPEPMNLGNAYVGEASHDAFNEVVADVMEVADVMVDVEEIEEVMEVHEFDEVSEVAEVVEHVEEIEEVLEVQDSMEIEDATQAEQIVHSPEAMDVEDWLNFDEVVEVQETLDVEEIAEVEDALNEVVISETEEIQDVELAAELQGVNVVEEVAVIETASADAEDLQVEDWLNFDEVVEVQETLDVEEIAEVEDALDEVLNIEEATEAEADNDELAEVDYLSDEIAIMDAEEVAVLDDVEQIRESIDVDAAIAEPQPAQDHLQVGVEEGGDSNWFASDEASESDTFFENFVNPDLETHNNNSAEPADDDIDPDLQNFLKGF